MEIVWVLLKQISIMFLYMAIGFLLYSRGLVTKEGSRTLANLLLYIILPCVIFNSFLEQPETQTIHTLLLSAGMGVLVLALSILISALLFRRRPMQNFSAAFSNAGFMGIPLITALFGSNAVFYSAAMIALLNILQWTYGQKLLSGERQKKNLSGLLINPLVISFAAGVCFFCFRLPFPDLLSQCVRTISGMNAPVAMIVMGVYLAQMNLSLLFRDAGSCWVSFVRLLLIPLVTIPLLYIIPADYPIMRSSLLIAACAPVGANVAVYAQKLEQNYTEAVRIVCLSTLFSIITMPLILAVSRLLW